MHSVFIKWLSRWWVLKKSNVCVFIIQTSGLHCAKKNCQNFLYLLSTLVDCRWGSLVARQICRQYSTSVFFSDESPFVSVQLWIGITAGFGGGGGVHTSCVNRREIAKITMWCSLMHNTTIIPFVWNRLTISSYLGVIELYAFSNYHLELSSSSMRHHLTISTSWEDALVTQCLAGGSAEECHLPTLLGHWTLCLCSCGVMQRTLGVRSEKTIFSSWMHVSVLLWLL